MGTTRHLSETFYSTRKQIFSQLDNVFYKMTFNWLKIPTYTKLKNTLGLSVKSVAYHSKEILSADGVLAALYERMKIISKWIRNSKVLGRGAVALDVLTSVPVVVEAFTSEKGDPIKTTAEEAGRLVGGFVGGDLGAKVGVAVATLVLGSVGGGPLAIGIVVCTIAGAYLGATSFSSESQKFAGRFYEWIEETAEANGEPVGFFDWSICRDVL